MEFKANWCAITITFCLALLQVSATFGQSNCEDLLSDSTVSISSETDFNNSILQETAQINSWLGALKPHGSQVSLSLLDSNLTSDISVMPTSKNYKGFYTSHIMIGLKKIDGKLSKEEQVRTNFSQAYGVSVFDLALRSRFPEAALPDEAISIYRHFFGDVVAVISSGNPSIISDSLGLSQEGPWHFHRPGMPEGIRPRDFSEITSFKDWRNSPELTIHNRDAGARTYFDPIRPVLWSLYLKNLKPEDRHKFLEALLKTSVEHYQSVEKSRSSQSIYNSATKSLQSFLQIFMKNAKAMGLSTNKSAMKVDRSNWGYRFPLGRDMQVEFSGWQLSDSENAEVESDIKGFIDSFKNTFRFPRKLSLGFSKDSREANYNEIYTYHLTAPYSYRVSREQESKTWQQSRPIAYHELGHLIFTFNYKINTIWESELKEHQHVARVGQVAAKIQPTIFFLAANELFADITAVAHSHDLEVMATSGLFPNDPETVVKKLLLRSFKTQSLPDNSAVQDPYAMLAPVRSYLGHDSYYLKLFNENPQLFVKKAFNAITFVLESTLKEASRYHLITVTEYNQKILEALEREK